MIRNPSLIVLHENLYDDVDYAYDDHPRNPNSNDRDHLVGQLTNGIRDNHVMHDDHINVVSCAHAKYEPLIFSAMRLCQTQHLLSFSQQYATKTSIMGGVS